MNNRAPHSTPDENTTDSGCATRYLRKIMRPDQLAALLASVRRAVQPATIVQCHGCFDIVHPGHVRYLQYARQQGDVLVVSITGDADVDKGTERPYIPQELRAENLAALEFVDYVVIDANPTACDLLGRLRPDIYVKGHEYATSDDPRFLAERKVVESYGGRVIYSSGQVVFSSSRLVENMSPASDLANHRLRLFCRRHQIDLASLSRLIDSMRGRRIVIAGDTVIERYVLCDATDVADEAPMMTLDQLDSRDYLGGAALVACQAAALGARPILVTRLGRDGLGSWATDALEQAGVNVQALGPRKETPTTTRFLVDDHKLFKLDRATARPLDSIGEQDAARTIGTAAAAADAAILFDCGLGMITPGLLRYAGEDLRRSVRVLAGGSANRHGRLDEWQNADLLFPTERQLRKSAGDFGSGLSAVAYRILDATETRRMLVLLGDGGLVTFDRRSDDPESTGWRGRLTSEHLQMPSDRIVDSLGSVEIGVTTAALALAARASLMQSAYLAAAILAIRTARMGPAPVTADELRRWIHQRGELAPLDAPGARTEPVERLEAPVPAESAERQAIRRVRARLAKNKLSRVSLI